MFSRVHRFWFPRGNRILSRLAGLAACAALPLTIANPALAQEPGAVSGRVVAQGTQQPLAGAQVLIVGTNRTALSDQDGTYLIAPVPSGEQQVRVSLLGYGEGSQTVVVPAGGTATANFELAISALELDAIAVNVVTGEEARRRELGSNTGLVPVTDLNLATSRNIADVLSGRSEGLVIQNVAGTTGTSQKIRIRGANSLSLSNEPLIFIDGVQVSNSVGGFGVGGQDPSRLNDINMDNVEDIQVIKGPAASSLYGTAAANGVLLITTKHGNTGPARWNAYAEYSSISDETDYPANVFTYDALGDPNAPVFVDGNFNGAEILGCPNWFAAQGSCTQDNTISFNTLTDPRTTPFTTGERKVYGLNVAGGGNEVTYFVSGEFEDETGVINYNTLDGVNLRANMTAQLADEFTLSVSSGYVDSDLGLPNNDNSIFSPILNGLVGKAGFIPGGTGPTADTRNYGFGFNMQDLQNLIIFQDVDRFTASANANYRPLAWLSGNLTLGLDLVDRHDQETLQPGLLPIAQSFALGFRQSQRSNAYLYTGNAAATATFDLSEDIVSTSTVGGSYSKDLFESSFCFGSSLTPGTSSCGSTGSLFDVDEAFSEVITIGGFFQQQFAYKDRLFVTGAVRGDDNSNFGDRFGLIYYPSASVSWVVREAPWFPEAEWLSSLRVRGAFGTSGLRPGFRDAITLLSPVAVTRNAESVAAVTLSNTGNPDLKPEKTTEFEGGLDFGLFDNRLGLDFTYYNKKSRDALVSRRLAPSLGLTGSVFENLGSIRNQGTELGLDAIVLDREEIGLDLRVAYSTLDNEILELGEDVEDIIINRGEQRHTEGYPAGSFFLQRVTFEDVNGDGLLSTSEVQVGAPGSCPVGRRLNDPDAPGDGSGPCFLGPVLPTWTVSLGANVRVFDFLQVNTLFDARGGNVQLNNSESFRCGFASGFAGFGCPGTSDPNAPLEEQAAFIADRFLGSAAGYVEEADFIKWREISVAFTPPESFVEAVPALRGARITLAGRNLATWTDYPGIDPEINETGGSSNFTQGEFNTQPPVRYLTVRVDYSF